MSLITEASSRLTGNGGLSFCLVSPIQQRLGIIFCIVGACLLLIGIVLTALQVNGGIAIGLVGLGLLSMIFVGHFISFMASLRAYIARQAQQERSESQIAQKDEVDFGYMGLEGLYVHYMGKKLYWGKPEWVENDYESYEAAFT